MIRNWTVSRSQPIHKDRWIDVRADDCVTPTGIEIRPYYVLTYPEWVHVVALTPDDGLVLVRQYRHGAGEVFLELPGGAVDAADASVEAAARRELLEETGFETPRWEHITTLHANPATHTNRLHTYLALGAVPGRPQQLEPGESGLEVEVWPVDEVLSGLKGGLIGHAMHVSAVLLGLAQAGRIRFGDHR